MRRRKPYTTEEFFKNLEKSLKKDSLVINKTLKTHLQSIVNTSITEKARPEAIRILLKSNKTEIGEFLYAHYSDGNGVGLNCIALDFIKLRLIKDGKLGKNTGKHFGNIDLNDL